MYKLIVNHKVVGEFESEERARQYGAAYYLDIESTFMIKVVKG